MIGRCAKRHVVCRIRAVHPSGECEWVEGSNWCANPQPVCPRAEGEDYTKCKTICQQQGHAEIDALALARKWKFDLKTADATIYGHYWMCQQCGKALRDAGVTDIRIEVAR